MVGNRRSVEFEVHLYRIDENRDSSQFERESFLDSMFGLKLFHLANNVRHGQRLGSGFGKLARLSESLENLADYQFQELKPILLFQNYDPLRAFVCPP